MNRVMAFERSLILTIFIAGAVAFTSTRPWTDYVLNSLSRPLEFHFRQWVGKDVKLDPRLVIYVVEDSTVEYLRREAMTLDEWASVIGGFQVGSPRAVMIDKMFSIPQADSEARSFVSKMKKLPFPVIAGGYFANGIVKSRPLLPTYDLTKGFKTEKITGVSTDEMNWLPFQRGFPYGPAENVREAFRYKGHILYNGDSLFFPVARSSQQQGLPAAPLFTAKDLFISREGLMVDDRIVPTDRNGKALVNFFSPNSYYDRADAMRLLLERVKNGEPFPKLIDDAVIFLVPNLFTGNADMKSTPFGNLPGSYVMASIINSVLTGQWISVLPKGWILVFLWGLSSIFFLTVLSNFSFWSAILLSLAFTVCGGLLSFSHWNVEVPWLFSSISLLLTASTVFALNARELIRRRIEGIAGTASPLDVKYDPKTGIPTRVGRYHITGKLGKGGMGEVYRAKTFGVGGFEKEFALKRIAPEYLNDESVVQSFLSEAKLTSLLTHLNIVQVFEFLRLEDTYLLVMEYVAGKPLAEAIRLLKKQGNKLPLPLSIHIVCEICKALEYAHTKTDPSTGAPLKLIHRDISPQNILLSTDGIVKVIDFGLAKGTFTTQKTKTGLLKGTIAYMSPEQATGEAMDSRSDLFSAALILYELVTGNRAFSGKTDFETLRELRECVVLVPSALDAGIPVELEKIIMKGLERDPKNRYQSASDFLDELTEFLRGLRFSRERRALSEFVLSLRAIETKMSQVVSTPTSSQKTSISEMNDAPPKSKAG